MNTVCLASLTLSNLIILIILKKHNLLSVSFYNFIQSSVNHLEPVHLYNFMLQNNQESEN